MLRTGRCSLDDSSPRSLGTSQGEGAGGGGANWRGGRDMEGETRERKGSKRGAGLMGQVTWHISTVVIDCSAACGMQTIMV